VFTRRGFTAAWWNKLTKRGIISRIDFPHANQSEDIPTIIQLIYYAENIGFMDDALYHYCLNPDSLSQATDRKQKRPEEVYANLKEAADFLIAKFRGKTASELEPELSNYINQVKIEHLLHKETRSIKKLFDLYPDSNRNIFFKGNRISFLKKILFCFALKKILFPWKILEAANPLIEFLYKAARSFYRVILPKKLRAKLWIQKNEKAA
jgi:hypothetical protein